MDISELKLKEIEDALFAGSPSAELLAACETDSRAGVQRLIRRFRREQGERKRLEALYAYEYAARDEGARFVAGVDEAGRGPLAGPVVVAAVILPYGLFLQGLNDSKKVAEKKRESLYEEIMAKAVAVRCSVVDAGTIDRVNIY